MLKVSDLQEIWNVTSHAYSMLHEHPTTEWNGPNPVYENIFDFRLSKSFSNVSDS